MIKFLLTVSIFLLLIIGFLHPISAMTQDLGRHFLTGKIILETHQIPKTNLFSYTYPNFPFINHHWLSEVIFYITYQAIGFNGLLIFSTIIVALAFSLVFFFSLKQANNIEALSIASLLLFRVLFERTDVRPEIFSFLFLSIFIFILYKYKKQQTKWIFILPVIELLWVNMHIYFPVGIAVIGLFLIDSIIIRKKIYCRYIGILAIVFLGIVFTVFLNPNGVTGALYPFRVFQNYGYSIEENQNIFFLWNYSHKPTIIFFALSAIILFCALFSSLKKTKPIDWLLAIFFTILAIINIRSFPLFVFGAFIPFVRSLSFVKVRPLQRSDLFKNAVLPALFAIFIWQIIEVSSLKGIGFGVEKGAEKGVDFFINQNLKGPIFNNFDIGSYLEYKLYPKEKVFVDGRPEAYPADFFQKAYIPMQENSEIFNKISGQYSFNSIIFAHTDQTPWAALFLKQIINNKNWRLIYLDDYIVIFIKETKENQKVVREINDSSLDINSLYRLAIFYNKVNLVEQEKITYQKILNINPNFCPALYNFSIILNQKQSPLASVFINRFNANCK